MTTPLLFTNCPWSVGSTGDIQVSLACTSVQNCFQVITVSTLIIIQGGQLLINSTEVLVHSIVPGESPLMDLKRTGNGLCVDFSMNWKGTMTLNSRADKRFHISGKQSLNMKPLKVWVKCIRELKKLQTCWKWPNWSAWKLFQADLSCWFKYMFKRLIHIHTTLFHSFYIFLIEAVEKVGGGRTKGRWRGEGWRWYLFSMELQGKPGHETAVQSIIQLLSL